MSELTPYRAVIFTTRFDKRGKRQECAYCLWTPEQHYSEARLPSAGSFLFPGLAAIRSEVEAVVLNPAVRQVSVRTNQDNQIARWTREKGWSYESI